MPDPSLPSPPDANGDAGRIRELERRVAELERSNDLATELARTAPDALLVVDGDGRIVHANRQVTDLLGHDAEELVGRSLEILLPERDRGSHKEHRRHFFAEPKARSMGSGLELWARHADGHELPVEISLSPIEVGGERLVASALRDASERATIERRLREARTRAERATADKTRFIAAASHDLRQPLQAATIYLDLLSEGSLEAEKIESVAGKARECIRSLRSLLDGILHISKLEAGAVIPRRREFRVQRLFDRLQAQFEPLARARKLELAFRPTAASAESDPMLVHRAVENLLSNAIRYTERGGVLVGCRRRGDTLRIQIWDTGPGIAEEEVERIFEAFYRGGEEAAARSASGLGLGLAIVRQIADLLDHPLDLRSRPGRGSLFELTLPRATDRPAAETPARRARPEGDLLLAILDDNPAIVDALRTVLEVAGNRVVAATSIDSMLDALRAAGRAPDALLTDYRLGGEETGLQALARVRDEFGSGIPALLLTGDSSFEALQRQAPGGDFRVVAKPVDARRLLAELDRCLQA